MSIALPTKNGGIALSDHEEHEACVACGDRGPVAKIECSAEKQGKLALVFFCGSCIAAALGVRLGAVHLRGTGELLDLSD